MPKILKLNQEKHRNKFVDMYQAKNWRGKPTYTVDCMAYILGISSETVNNYRKELGLSRNKRRNNND